MTVFIAIGIILSAAVLCCALGARLGRAADSRGFTLQTLIVTAVLVLVAAGVTVVIIALTRGSSDNLEGASRTDMEGPEARYGVLTPDGEVSKTWRCALHQDVVFSGNGEHLQCKDRCWGSLSTQGKQKWNWLAGETVFQVDNPLPDDKKKAVFAREDFDGIVYSETNPGPAYPKLTTNGSVMTYNGTCILPEEICEFPPSQRDSLLQRWQNSLEATGTDGLPQSPLKGSELPGILDGCT